MTGMPLLLDRRSLETCLPELRQSLTYVLHLRAHWKPEGHAKLIVPTSWMEFLALADGECGAECATNRCCPFRNVRFESAVGLGGRMTVPDEELPRNVLSQVLTDSGIDTCLATLVTRAFGDMPRTSPRSDVPPGRCIDIALVPRDDILPEDDVRCLLFGMKEPIQHSLPATSFDSRSRPIPKELTDYGQFYLTLLTSLIKGETSEITTKSFPEWLVLFGLLYDGHHLRIIACLPRYISRPNVIGCVAYIVDELTLRPDFTVVSTNVPVSSCEGVLERLRLLLALTSLRRHVLHLSKLFTTIGSRDGLGRYPSLHARHQHHSDLSGVHTQSSRWSRYSSLHRSSEYSTCPSGVHPCESNDINGKDLSSHTSFTSFSSICSSLLESDSTSDSFRSEDSKYTDPNNYMEPFAENVGCPKNPTETKRLEIIAWARRVIPTEHPVKDTYKMIAQDSKEIQTQNQVR